MDYAQNTRQTLGECAPVDQTSDLQRILERIYVSEKLVSEVSATAEMIGDRMYGCRPENDATPAPPKRYGIIGNIEDALDSLGYTIDQANERIARLKNAA